jgi:uncharacterized membrane protein YccC
MPDLSVTRRFPLGRPTGAAQPPSAQAQGTNSAKRTRPAWLPAWSVPAGMRMLRAVIVIPSLFALCYEGFGNLQMALFAAFGGFASLIFAAFGGTRRDKVTAHFMLALVGSIGLIIGTAVNGITWLAVLVAIPVAFGIFFAGVAGPNAASGVTAALLPFVLSVATPGTMSMVGDRLAGWWLASVVATAAVLLLSPPSPGDRLRAAAATSARVLAEHLEAAVAGTATAAGDDKCQVAKRNLLNVFATTPFRPTGLATADQGLASVVQLLEWCTALIGDATHGHPNLDQADQCDLDLFATTAAVLRQTGDLLAATDDTSAALPDPTPMERQREASAVYHRSRLPGDYDSVELVARQAFHAQAISIAVQALVDDTLIATRRADPETIAARRRGWYGAQPEGTMAERRVAGLSGAIGVIARHASFRSVWLQNSLRGSLALAAAVLVADLSGVQHGFWVVLGTLSVLRTNAASTESTALRALGGTVIGFVAGALLLLGIGTSTPALWVAFPIALAVAAYAPGTLPFAFGQAAFTIVVVVLFNLLQPAGWKVGLLRIEDVAIGCLVSVIVGVLFWPRGAASVVGDDLADSFRSGAAYLTQAVDWALGSRQAPPDAGAAAVTASIRLDEALRGFLSEQGAKRLSKEDLWMLVMAAMRLRLTSFSLAGLQAPDSMMPSQSHRGHPHRGTAYARAALARAAADLAGFYERVAVLVGRPVAHQVLLPAVVPAFVSLTGSANGSDNAEGDDASVRIMAEAVARADGAGQDDAAGHPDLVRVITEPHHPHLLWVHEHLQHLSSHAQAIAEPASHVAEQRRVAWWR